jgi:hypothetical protein
MRYQDAPNWPPVWTQMRIGSVKTVTGELGVLTYVHGSDYSHKCYLVTTHENENYVATLPFDDAVFCQLITKLLRQHIGKSIKDIGDLDVDYTLEPHCGS